MEFFTIGVYNSTEIDFFYKLKKNNIDTFCDIRQRRGVRGSQYSFVNSNRLQIRLSELAIKYEHLLTLAPTTEIRMLQKEADSKQGELKRNRNKLGLVFKTSYNKKVLDQFDFNDFILNLSIIGADRIVLFCVEEKSDACHRSMVAERLLMMGYKITNL